jgi:uncharacterized protein
LPVRALHTSFKDGFARRWFGGDAFASAYYNALSMSFPAGEQRFIDSLKNALPLLPHTPAADAMREQVRDFCAQEATHRHVHAQYNAVLASQGFVNTWEARIHARYAQFAHIDPRHHLAITVAYEHYTAVFSQVLLSRPAMTAAMDPTLRRVWLWHAMEETEHKAVAFDLYRAVGGNEAWRRRWFVRVSVMFATDLLRQTVRNLHADGALFKPGTWWSAWCFFLGRPSRGGGWVWQTVGPLWQFMRSNFHPWQHDNTGDARAYAEAHSAEWRLVR